MGSSAREAWVRPLRSPSVEGGLEVITVGVSDTPEARSGDGCRPRPDRAGLLAS